LAGMPLLAFPFSADGFRARIEFLLVNDFPGTLDLGIPASSLVVAF